MFIYVKAQILQNKNLNEKATFKAKTVILKNVAKELTNIFYYSFISKAFLCDVRAKNVES